MATEKGLRERALDFYREACRHQKKGDVAKAAEFYRKSIDIFPTAEAHTFLGWTYSLTGEYDAAIAECRRAIQIDPDYGKPYNDIGAYLIEKGKINEAIAWFEKALRAPRYECRCLPHYNLGRVWEIKHDYPQALQSYQQAIQCDPNYFLARAAVRRLKAQFD